nr:DUF1848 domain-containing protein [uncultured Acetatifactor sp.]
MILSASRRTDIPAYYSEWFLNRMKEGFLYVRNPMNPHQISRIDLSPEVVDCIVFWTKNPADMMGRLGALERYPYYFQFTLTGYGKDMEPNLPDKREVLIPAFRKLSERIGKERVIWRYDPVLVNRRYTAAYHVKAFGEIADSLADHTRKVVISFVDMYAKLRRNARTFGFGEVASEDMVYLAGEMARIAAEHGLAIESCAEQADLREAGIRHGSCIDQRLIEEITGCSFSGGKDRNQRKECGCLESIEVGAYDTCLNGCRYCYANHGDGKVRETAGLYRADSPLLCGEVGSEDKVTDRKVKSLKDAQMRWFS